MRWPHTAVCIYLILHNFFYVIYIIVMLNKYNLYMTLHLMCQQIAVVLFFCVPVYTVSFAGCPAHDIIPEINHTALWH